MVELLGFHKGVIQYLVLYIDEDAEVIYPIASVWRILSNTHPLTHWQGLSLNFKPK